MGAGGGEHEQRAEGDEEQDKGEQEEIHVLLVALVEGDEEQDQGEQEEIHFFQANMSMEQANMREELKVMRSKTKESKRISMGFMTFLRSFHRT